MRLAPGGEGTCLLNRSNGERVKLQLLRYQDDFMVEISVNKYLPAVLLFPLKGCISMETMKPGSPIV